MTLWVNILKSLRHFFSLGSYFSPPRLTLFSFVFFFVVFLVPSVYTVYTVIGSIRLVLFMLWHVGLFRWLFFSVEYSSPCVSCKHIERFSITICLFFYISFVHSSCLLYHEIKNEKKRIARDKKKKKIRNECVVVNVLTTQRHLNGARKHIQKHIIRCAHAKLDGKKNILLASFKIVVLKGI